MPTVVYFIPRVIWPDKPITMLGRDFGRIFRVTNTFTGSTYVGATVPGELYWNFDLPGILVGMAILGVGVRFLYRRYGEAGTESPVLLATHIMLLVQVAHLGSSLAAAFVLIVRTLVLLELLRWFCRRFHMIEPVERPVPAEAETATVRP
jgi:hypothetical protein